MLQTAIYSPHFGIAKGKKALEGACPTGIWETLQQELTIGNVPYTCAGARTVAMLMQVDYQQHLTKGAVPVRRRTT